MNRPLVSIALAGSVLLAGCGGSSNSSHSTPPPPVNPPPPTSTSFTAYVNTLLKQAENSAPSEVNDVTLTFPDDANPTAFDNVVGSQ